MQSHIYWISQINRQINEYYILKGLEREENQAKIDEASMETYKMKYIIYHTYYTDTHKEALETPSGDMVQK